MPYTTVIHVKRAPANWRDDPAYIYIGRGSPWGNPYRIGPDGTRAEVITKYAAYLRSRRADLIARLGELHGRTLVCYCHPAPCHGDILARLADANQRRSS